MTMQQAMAGGKAVGAPPAATGGGVTVQQAMGGKPGPQPNSPRGAMSMEQAVAGKGAKGGAAQAAAEGGYKTLEQAASKKAQGAMSPRSTGQPALKREVNLTLQISLDEQKCPIHFVLLVLSSANSF